MNDDDDDDDDDDDSIKTLIPSIVHCKMYEPKTLRTEEIT